MPRSRPPYSPEFRRQMVELVRAGGDPEDLSREFEPTSPSIRNWVAQSDRQEGRRAPQADLLGMAERDELIPACESPDFRRLVFSLPGAPPPWANPARDTARRKSGLSPGGITRLRREVRQLRQERDILSKAAA